jgi:hypothetical protein
MNQLLTREAETLPAFVFGQPEAENLAFSVDSEDKASWAAAKILAAERRIQLRLDLAERYKERIDQWLHDANRPDTESIDFLKMLLRPWAESSIRTQSRSRSIKLLGATIGLRKRPDRVELIDPDSVLEYCEAHLPDAVIIKREVSKTSLKQALIQGQDIPGAILAIGEDELTIKEGA